MLELELAAFRASASTGLFLALRELVAQRLSRIFAYSKKAVLRLGD